MAIVSVAIVLSFHVKNQPSAAELAMARPLGVLFWLLSVACLLVGLGNYIGTSMYDGSVWSCMRTVWKCLMLTLCLCVRFPETVNKYSRKAAIVQSGFKTQVVSVEFLERDPIRCRCFTDTNHIDYGVCVRCDYCNVCDIAGDK